MTRFKELSGEEINLLLFVIDMHLNQSTYRLTTLENLRIELQVEFEDKVGAKQYL